MHSSISPPLRPWGALVRCAVLVLLALLPATGCDHAATAPDAAVDLGPAADLSTPGDASVPADLAPPADLRPAPDLAPCVPGLYPAAPYGSRVGDTLSSSLGMRDSSGQALPLTDLYAPCADQASVLVLRLSAAWCGTCQWAVAHGDELLAGLSDRVTLWEALASDEQNLPVSDAALARFAATLPASGGRAVRHPSLSHGLLPQLGVTPAGGERLPLVLVIDRRSMKVRARLADPDPDTLRGTVQQVLAVADGLPAPPLAAPVLQDGRFTRDRWAQIQAMALPSPLVPPADPTNAVADLPLARNLGRNLFLDSRIGGVAMISCTNCHEPMKYYQDGRATALGTNPEAFPTFGDRNSPWLAPTAFQAFQFWDGRADSQWMQALGPMENDSEYSSTRLFIVRTVLGLYGPTYQQLFGDLPDLSDTTRFPLSGRPGMDAWDNMAPADQAVINRAFSNVGKAVTAFERTILPQPMPLDRYAGGASDALSDAQKDGLLAFFDLGCATCHHGPFLWDGAFHAMGVGTGRQDRQPDQGRREGLPRLLASEFNGAGPFSDDPAAGRRKLAGLADDPVLAGQFKTPSLRGVADSSPYGHGGAQVDLTKFLQTLAAGGEPAAGLPTAPERDVAMVQFNPADPRLANLVLLLKTLRGTVPPF